MGDLKQLPGARRTPETLLHQTLAKAPRIKAIGMVIMWDDGSFDADWSSMKSSELAAMGLILADEAKEVLRQRTGTPCPPAPEETA